MFWSVLDLKMTFCDKMGPSTGGAHGLDMGLGWTQIKEIIYMNRQPKTLEQKFNIASKVVGISFFVSFISSFLLSMAFMYLETSWQWLVEWKWLVEAIAGALIRYAFLALTVSMLIPCLLILIFPALGYAWLRGSLRWAFYPYKPWREVSDGEAFLNLLYAMFSFAMGALILHQLIVNGMFGQVLASFIPAKLASVNLWLHQP